VGIDNSIKGDKVGWVQSLSRLSLAGYRYGGEVDGRGKQGTADPPRLAADSGNIFERPVDIAGDHCVLDAADYLAVFYLEAEEDIAAEIAAEDVTL